MTEGVEGEQARRCWICGEFIENDDDEVPIPQGLAHSECNDNDPFQFGGEL